jgi:prepilin-type processing-associated H-X9-DG protein
LYDKFERSKPINNNDPTNVRNREARGTPIPVLLCPTDENNRVPYTGAAGTTHGDNWARGNYAGNAGRAFLYGPTGCSPAARCMQGPDTAGWLDDCKRGVMGPNVAVKIGKIADGTSKTILVGELRTGLTEKDARGVWALGHAGASLLAMYGSGGDDNGPNVCNPAADDVYSDICFTLGRQQCMTCDPGYFAQATVRSVHSGGAFVAMCDGSVTYIVDEIETSNSCCSPWDFMITSGDEGKGGAYNGVTNGCL